MNRLTAPFRLNIAVLALAACTPSLKSGTGVPAGSAMESAPIALNVEGVFPTSNWNDYVLGSVDQQGYLIVKEACPERVRTDHEAPCYHAGERRRVLLPDSYHSCEGLQLVEFLEVFNWNCRNRQGKRPVEFFTVGFKKKKGLRDLIDGLHWKPNRVVVSDGRTTLRSAHTIWWRNAIQLLPANEGSGVVNLKNAGAIYVLDDSRMSDGYRVFADKVSIVVPKNAVLSPSAGVTSKCSLSFEAVATPGANPCIVSTEGRSFVWIEGKMNGPLVGDQDLSQLSKKFSLVRRDPDELD